MTEIKCPICKTELVMFNDDYVKPHKKEENWLMAQCTKCNKMVGVDGT